VVLAYRPTVLSDFVTREMDAVEGSTRTSPRFQPRRPARIMAYYIQAQDGQGQLLAQNGEQPTRHIVNLAPRPPRRHHQRRD